MDDPWEGPKVAH